MPLTVGDGSAGPWRPSLAHARHPWAVPAIAARTLAVYGASYVDQFVGRFGWLDTTLPAGYRLAALVVLGLALVAACLGPVRRPGGAWLAAGVALAVASVFGLQYLSWTPPGDPVVEGVQGRYFLPLALAGGVGLLPAVAWPSCRRLRAGLVVIVALFPAASLAMTVQAIVARYYLS